MTAATAGLASANCRPAAFIPTPWRSPIALMRAKPRVPRRTYQIDIIYLSNPEVGALSPQPCIACPRRAVDADAPTPSAGQRELGNGRGAGKEKLVPRSCELNS